MSKFKVKADIKDHAGKIVEWAENVPYEFGYSIFREIKTGEIVKIDCDELMYLGRYLDVVEE